MRIERYSSSLDQILNQHKVDPIDEVFLNREEFNSVLNSASNEGILDHTGCSSDGEGVVHFTVKHYALLFVFDK